MKNKLLVIQICALIAISGSLGGLLFRTSIYEGIEFGTVRVLCLSCIKLQPITSKDFTFETANNKPHPNFVINALKTKGPIMIQYGEPGCTNCDLMINNVMIPYFNLSFSEKHDSSFETLVNVGNVSFYYIYIYVDPIKAKTEKTESIEIYDKDYVRGYPMFTIITLEYHHGGEVRPYYTSLYGLIEENIDWQKRFDIFIELLEDGQELYDRNIAAYK